MPCKDLSLIHILSPLLNKIIESGLEHLDPQQNRRPDQKHAQILIRDIDVYNVFRDHRVEQIAERHDKGAEHIRKKQNPMGFIIRDTFFDQPEKMCISDRLLTFETGDRLFTETVLKLTPSHEFLSLECACPVGVDVFPGTEIKSERLRITVPDDSQEAIDAYAARKALRYHARKGEHVPSVYCTWYYYGLTVSEADVRENLAALLDRPIPFEVFQVDEGWERCLGDWRPNERFPLSLIHISSTLVRYPR